MEGGRIKKRIKVAWGCLVIILGIIPGMWPVIRVEAQSAEELELVDLINKLRANRGLVPYSVDPTLMVLAREHSVYQTSIHQSTHQHSDGHGLLQIDVVENVAGGVLGWITPWKAICNIW